jgi:hypothetical protein
LVLLLNTVFVFLFSFAVAYLAGWVYHKTGSLTLLLLGAGAFTVALTIVISFSLVAQ